MRLLLILLSCTVVALLADPQIAPGNYAEPRHESVILSPDFQEDYISKYETFHVTTGIHETNATTYSLPTRASDALSTHNGNVSPSESTQDSTRPLFIPIPHWEPSAAPRLIDSGDTSLATSSDDVMSITGALTQSAAEASSASQSNLISPSSLSAALSGSAGSAVSETTLSGASGASAMATSAMSNAGDVEATTAATTGAGQIDVSGSNAPSVSMAATDVPVMTLTVTTTPPQSFPFPVASLFPSTTLSGTTYDQSDPNTPLYECFDKAALDFLTPRDPEFEEEISRVWNQILDTQPAAYLTPYSISEVADAVRCAVASNRTVTARGGGHSYVGASRGQNGGVTVDLKYMNEVVLNSEYAYIGGGARMGTVYYQLWQDDKRLVPGGTCPQVGAIAITMGGGQGIASRNYGLMADNVVEYDVVLATGEIVKANATTNTQLFWGLRGGGGGNFGIATRMKMKTHSPPSLVSAYMMVVPLNLTGSFLTQILSFSKTAPPEFGGYFAIASIGVVGYLTYMGSLRDLEFYAHDFLSVWDGTVTLTPIETDWINLYYQVSQTTYPSASVRQLELTPDFEQPGVYSHIKSLIARRTDDIPAAVLQALQLQVTVGAPAIGLINVELIGGNINAVASDATAFPHRDGTLLIEPTLTSNVPLTASDELWLTNIYELLLPYVTGGSYVNFADDNLPNPGSSFYGENFADLQILKEVWDPRNTFNFSLSINNLES